MTVNKTETFIKSRETMGTKLKEGEVGAVGQN